LLCTLVELKLLLLLTLLPPLLAKLSFVIVDVTPDALLVVHDELVGMSMACVGCRSLSLALFAPPPAISLPAPIFIGAVVEVVVVVEAVTASLFV
jgi:hypothetical protein